MSEGRLISLDVFRGMTIAGMVLVNNPGGSPVYGPLNHAEWHGLTPTDWIFPFFLFIVGVSIAISLGRRPAINDGEKSSRAKLSTNVYLKILTRAASIYLLGAAMSILPFFQFQATDAPDFAKMLVWLLLTASLFFLLLRKFWWALGLLAAALAGIAWMNLAGYNVVPYNFGTLRIMGVLQRIAVVYAITAVLFLHTTWRQQVGISVILLLGYWLIMSVVPVPGCDVTTIDDKACNLAAYLDRFILTENHIWRGGKVYDPEGLLSTIPAIVTALSGVLTGRWFARNDEVRMQNDESTPPLNSSFIIHHSSLNKVAGLFFFGTVLLAVGYIWSYYLPLNKALWTSSYVVVTSGLALLVLGACYWLIDLKGYKKWAWPFVVFGVNALPLFVFSGIAARMLSAYRVTGIDGSPVSLSRWSMQNIFLPVLQPIDASLAFAVIFILIWLVLMWLLYRRRIYLKV